MNEKEQGRYEALSAKDKRFFDTIRSVDVGNFDIRVGEIVTIAEMNDNNAVNASTDFFYYGFIKGQRAAKAAQKKAGTMSQAYAEAVYQVASSIKCEDLQSRLLSFAVHIAAVNDQREHFPVKTDPPPTTRQKIDRLLDQIEPGKALDGIYWHINKRLAG